MTGLKTNTLHLDEYDRFASPPPPLSMVWERRSTTDGSICREDEKYRGVDALPVNLNLNLEGRFVSLFVRPPILYQ